MRTSKTRGLRLVIALAAAMAMVLPAVPATAEKMIMGEPSETCLIFDGDTIVVPLPSLVEVKAGLAPPVNGRFNFTATLMCVGVPTKEPDKENTYDIAAFGESTDMHHGNLSDKDADVKDKTQTDGAWGETIEQGGTVKEEKEDVNGDPVWEYKTGAIIANNVDPGGENIQGRFQFVRLGVVVMASGYLNKSDTTGPFDIENKQNPKDPKVMQQKKKDGDPSFRWFTAVATAVPDPLTGFTTAEVIGDALIFDNDNVDVLCVKQKEPNNRNICDETIVTDDLP